MSNTINSLLQSRRQYAVAFIEGDATCTYFPTISYILENNPDPYEYINAINEKIDLVLDLKVGERLHMEFNRDNKDSAGYIKRTA